MPDEFVHSRSPTGVTVEDPAGYTQFLCTGDVVDAADLNTFDDRLEMGCDMGGGASGGPMATTEGQIVGANSHAEINDNDERINDTCTPRTTGTRPSR